MSKTTTKQSQALFPNEPLRKSDGRFCTKEQYRLEKVDGENTRLRFERDKYYRAWMSMVEENKRLRLRLREIKNSISELNFG